VRRRNMIEPTQADQYGDNHKAKQKSPTQHGISRVSTVINIGHLSRNIITDALKRR
jgi:hypothetical protein